MKVAIVGASGAVGKSSSACWREKFPLTNCAIWSQRFLWVNKYMFRAKKCEVKLF